MLGCYVRGEPAVSSGPGSAVTDCEGFRIVKKLLLLLVLAGLGVFAVWRKVQADRAELDLWTEATTSDE